MKLHTADGRGVYRNRKNKIVGNRRSASNWDADEDILFNSEEDVIAEETARPGLHIRMKSLKGSGGNSFKVSNLLSHGRPIFAT